MMFRPMRQDDALIVFAMMRGFYDAHDGVSTVPDEVLWANVRSCVDNDPLLDGWVFEEDSAVSGYAICSHGYSTLEAKQTIRVEDLFVDPPYRASEVGARFLKELPELYPEAASVSVALSSGSRLEQSVYKQLGYREKTLMVTKRRA